MPATSAGMTNKRVHQPGCRLIEVSVAARPAFAFFAATTLCGSERGWADQIYSAGLPWSAAVSFSQRLLTVEESMVRATSLSRFVLGAGAALIVATAALAQTSTPAPASPSATEAPKKSEGLMARTKAKTQAR